MSCHALQLQVLSDMVPPDAHHALLGQYERYVDHVRADVAKWGSEEAIAAHDQSKPTRTPTFAAAELLIENARCVRRTNKLPLRRLCFTVVEVVVLWLALGFVAT